MNLAYFLFVKIKKGKKNFTNTALGLSTFNISIGLAALILAFFVLDAFKQNVNNRIYALSGTVQIRPYQNIDAGNSSQININDLNNIELIKKQKICYVAEKPCLLRINSELKGAVLKGISDSMAVPHELISKKSLITPLFSEESIIIGSYLAKQLKADIDSVVIVYFLEERPRYRKLTISGIFETSIEELDEILAITPIKLITQINQSDSNLAHYAQIMDLSANNSDFIGQLNTELPLNTEAVNVRSLYPQIFDWLDMLDKNNVMLLVLISAIIIFSVISAVVIMVLERKAFVSVLKVTGCTNGTIIKTFSIMFLNSLVPSLVAGNLLTLILYYLQTTFKLFKLDKANYYIDHVPMLFNLTTLILVNLLIIVIASVTAFLTIWNVTANRRFKINLRPI